MKAKAVNKTEMTGPDMDVLVREMIDTRRSIVTTDEYSGYNGLNHFVAHRRISYATSYVERDLYSAEFGPVHTNTIESAWAILKRAIMGQFHHVSRKYLPLYLNEITFRHNARKASGTFDNLLHLAVNP